MYVPTIINSSQILLKLRFLNLRWTLFVNANTTITALGEKKKKEEESAYCLSEWIVFSTLARWLYLFFVGNVWCLIQSCCRHNCMGRKLGRGKCFSVYPLPLGKSKSDFVKPTHAWGLPKQDSNGLCVSLNLTNPPPTPMGPVIDNTRIPFLNLDQTPPKSQAAQLTPPKQGATTTYYILSCQKPNL